MRCSVFVVCCLLIGVDCVMLLVGRYLLGLLIVVVRCVRFAAVRVLLRIVDRLFLAKCKRPLCVVCCSLCCLLLLAVRCSSFVGRCPLPVVRSLIVVW